MGAAISENASDILHRAAKACPGDVQWNESGTGFVARCPAHEDHNPSLSVDLSDGKVLWNCFAGCTQDAVGKALGIIGEPAPPRTRKKKPAVNTWHYRTVKGADIVVTRRVAKNGKKTFVRSPTGNKDLLLPLAFEAPAQGAVLLIVEGEKCVDAAKAAGIAHVTTWAGGSKAVARTEWGGIADCHVVLWPDNDGGGVSAMQQLAGILRDQGCRCLIPRPLSGWPVGHDIADMSPTDAHERFVQLCGRFEAEPAPAPDKPPPAAPELDLTPPFDLELPDEIITPPHILRGVLERRAVSLLFGAAGHGKSSMAVREILSVATGRELMGVPVERTKVLVWWADESHLAFQAKVRGALSHEGIDRGEIAGAIKCLGRPGGRRWEGDLAPQRAEDVCNWIAGQMREHGCEVLYLDSLSTVAPDAESGNAEATAALKCLEELAIAGAYAVRLLHHSRKRPPGQQREADMDEARGASAISSRVRISHQIIAEAEGNERVYSLTPVKSSNFELGAETKWRVQGGVINSTGQTAPVIVPYRETDPFEGVAQEAQDAALAALAAAAPDDRRDNPSATGWAGVLVATTLAFDPGPLARRDRTDEQQAVRDRVRKMLERWRRGGFIQHAEERMTRVNRHMKGVFTSTGKGLNDAG